MSGSENGLRIKTKSAASNSVVNGVTYTGNTITGVT
jgi:polygalacturonase